MLTKECANYPWWVDTETASGCSRPTQIDDCKAYAEEYNTEKENDND